MKLHNRQPVPGTESPKVYIGHRVYAAKNGSSRVAKKWYATWFHEGRRRTAKLSTTNKTTAIRKVHDLAAKIRDGEPVASKPKIEIAAMVRQYMEYQRANGRAPKTIEKYSYVLEDQFVPWCAARHRAVAERFSPQDFWAYAAWLSANGKSQKTAHDRQIIIKQLFKWATTRAQLLSVDPLAGEKLRDPVPTEQPCFEPKQVATLLDNADPHEKAIYAVMAYTGLRFGEVQQLRWSDIRFEQGGGTITVQRGGSGTTTKGRQTRHVPIHPDLRRILDTVPRTHEHVFTARPSRKHPNGGGLISERRLLLALKRLCKRCRFADWRKYKLHTFRHAFASMLARNRVPDGYAMRLMGHKNSRVFDAYFRMYDDTATAAISTINYATTQPEPTVAA